MPGYLAEIRGSEHLCTQQLCESGHRWIHPVPLVLQRWQLTRLFYSWGEPDACAPRVAGQRITSDLPKYNCSSYLLTRETQD